ncbi:MAG: ABC transporter ATP-binding protein [Gemmatimonadales bacterium]
MTAPLLSARDVTRTFPGARPGQEVHAVNGVSLDVFPGETLGLVGESGCGKSTLGRMVVGLDRPSGGTVTFDGEPVHTTSRAARAALTRQVQIVFQDPYSSLDPRMTVAESIAEGIRIHRLHPAGEVHGRVEALMHEVGLDPAAKDRYPHEFSGGQRQRVGIARALAVEPRLMVCDEPVSALDVSVQAQVLNLLADLQQTRGLAYLFIAHDLAVVRQLAHRIAVMYLGRLVEVGPAAEVTDRPRHPYTRALRSAVPRLDSDRQPGRIILAGDPPSPMAPPPGCAFAPRCFHPRKDGRCTAEQPALRAVGPTLVACHYAEES